MGSLNKLHSSIKKKKNENVGWVQSRRQSKKDTATKRKRWSSRWRIRWRTCILGDLDCFEVFLRIKNWTTANREPPKPPWGLLWAQFKSFLMGWLHREECSCFMGWCTQQNRIDLSVPRVTIWTRAELTLLWTLVMIVLCTQSMNLVYHKYRHKSRLEARQNVHLHNVWLVKSPLIVTLFYGFSSLCS